MSAKPLALAVFLLLCGCSREPADRFQFHQLPGSWSAVWMPGLVLDKQDGRLWILQKCGEMNYELREVYRTDADSRTRVIQARDPDAYRMLSATNNP